MTGVALLSAGVQGQEIVIDFDDLIGQAPVPNGYGGVADWSTGGWWYYDFDQHPYNPSSGRTRVYATQQNNSFRFEEPVVLLGAYFAGFGQQDGFPPISWSLYYNGDLVHTSNTLDLSGTPTFLDSGYGGLVDRAVVNGTTQFFVMDDLTYVPTPATGTLLALSSLMATRRRR